MCPELDRTSSRAGRARCERPSKRSLPVPRRKRRSAVTAGEECTAECAVAELTATYRLQMNARFTFAHARARADYFAKLGVSHLYLSPILMARRGSMHGYDVVDQSRINPELGTEADLRALATDLRSRDMGLIVD